MSDRHRPEARRRGSRKKQGWEIRERGENGDQKNNNNKAGEKIMKET